MRVLFPYAKIDLIDVKKFRLFFDDFENSVDSHGHKYFYGILILYFLFVKFVDERFMHHARLFLLLIEKTDK